MKKLLTIILIAFASIPAICQVTCQHKEHLKKMLSFEETYDINTYKDRAILFGSISVATSSAVPGYILVPRTNKYGTFFFGTFAAVSVTSAVIATYNFIKYKKKQKRLYKKYL